MAPELLRALLGQVASGALGVEEAIGRLVELPFEDLGFARVDHHRAIRTGFPEAVWGRDKEPDHIAAIVGRLLAVQSPVLVTGVDATKAEEVQLRLSENDREQVRYEPTPRLLVGGPAVSPRGRGVIAVVAAGTSDLPVAEEAARTAEVFGMEVARFTDVGVAGLQRILAVRNELERCEVVVVVAGMEGALPPVVKGLVTRPVIAVPTSVGYGAALGGLTPMLGMLTACAPGLTVVNVDGGFSAGYAAAVINLDRARLQREAGG